MTGNPKGPKVEKNKSKDKDVENIKYLFYQLTEVDSSQWKADDVPVLFKYFLGILKVRTDEDINEIRLKAIINIFNYLILHKDNKQLSNWINGIVGVYEHVDKLDMVGFHQLMMFTAAIFEFLSDPEKKKILAKVRSNPDMYLDQSKYDFEGGEPFSEHLNRRRQIFDYMISFSFLLSTFNSDILIKVVSDFLYFETQQQEVGFVDIEIDARIGDDPSTYKVSLKQLPLNMTIVDEDFEDQGILQKKVSQYLAMLGNVLGHFDYDVEELLLRLNTITTFNFVPLLHSEIYVAAKLEALRPGSVKELRDKFGIVFLSRYIKPEARKAGGEGSQSPSEQDTDIKMLLDMLTDGEKYKKTICIFSPGHDHSLTFWSDYEREMYYDAYFKLKSKGIKLVFVESMSIEEVSEDIKIARESSGVDNFDALMIRSHGHKYNLNLGESDADIVSINEIKDFLLKLRSDFSEDAPLIYNACGVGRDNGIAFNSIGVFDKVYSGKGNFGSVTKFDPEIDGNGNLDLSAGLEYMMDNKLGKKPIVRTRSSRK